MNIRLSQFSDLTDLMEIFHQAQATIGQLGIDQWQNGYPSEKVIATGVVVDCMSLRIRKGPGTRYESAGSLAGGTQVEIYEIKTVGSVKWGRISNGWISLDYVKMDSSGSNESAVYTVKASSLRIRSRGISPLSLNRVRTTP